MMDQIFKPTGAASRRNRGNTSETSSNKGGAVDPITSPARQSIKALHTEEPTRTESREIKKPTLESVSRSKKESVKPERNSDDEDLPSPAVKNIGKAKLAKTKQEFMRSSSVYQKSELQKSIKLAPQAQGSEAAYKIKIIIFILISLFLTYSCMFPARKCPPKRQK